MQMVRIAIFVSGNGTNCENIINHFVNSKSVEIALVLSNRADAYAIVRSQKHGVPTVVLAKAEFAMEDKLMPIMQQYHIDFIVLAGFLLMIPNFLIAAYEHKMINLHPALLPKFGGKGMYGHYVHEAVKAAGETETGITIHYVSNVCDGGEIIEQFKVGLTSSDTIYDIEQKIHVLEQANYPQVIERVVHRDFPI